MINAYSNSPADIFKGYETTPITIGTYVESIPTPSFIAGRPSDYDSTLIWSPEEIEWLTVSDNIVLFVTGGGRYIKRTTIITLDEFGNGKIFTDYSV